MPRETEPAVESKTGAEDVPEGSSEPVKSVEGPPKRTPTSSPNFISETGGDDFHQQVNT